MTHKFLLITAGTAAAGVGQEFIKQVKTHSVSELQAVVRYIDTAHLPTRYSGLRNSQWFQLTTSPQLMDAIRRNQENYPYLKDLLYPDFLPHVRGSRGGSIRYNAAGAIAINRARIKEWLTTSITDLAKSGGRQVNLSIALVVSAAGATGSGIMERLVDIIVDCAQISGIPSPVHLDVFILQPGIRGVSDLGLANTLALYAEMAATRLLENDSSSKGYRGRTIMVGWGSERPIASIDQLKEAAATLVRLTHDPATDIAAEFQEREIDNHVLLEQDWQTQLPTHLSSATAVTISLGDLEEQIIQRDAVRLVEALVFGADKSERQAGPQLEALTSYLQGETSEDRYRHLTDRLTEVISLQTLQTTSAQLKRLPAQQQAIRLMSLWQSDKEEIAMRGRQIIREQGATLVRNALQIITRSHREAIATRFSLYDLRHEYQVMGDLFNSTLAYAAGVWSDDAYDAQVMRKINALERAIWGKERALQEALRAMQLNLLQTLQRVSRTIAIEVLRALEYHCAESLRDLEVVLQRFSKQRDINPKWAVGYQQFHIDKDHVLHMAALSTPEEITHYADMVSIFSADRVTIDRIVGGEEQKVDQLTAFRRWLDDQGKLDVLFTGEINALWDLAKSYARKYVHVEIKQHSVVDVLLQAGEEVLVQRLREASSRAHSSVSFNGQIADNLKEARLISAYYRDEEQRGLLQKAINQVFGTGQSILISSKDPSEIAVFYYVDGLPMSAVMDLTGRCLDAFLKRRRAWYRQSKLNGSGLETSGSDKQHVGVSIYSGRDAQQRVTETGVISQLYNLRGLNIDTYSSEEVPELTRSDDV